MKSLEAVTASSRPGISRIFQGKDSPLIPDEEFFTRLLTHERKRSERTGDPFVLMILDLAPLNGHAPARSIAEVYEAIRVATRDTDHYGWYRYPSAIGGLFTALQNADRVSIESVLTAKVERALRAVLEPAEAASVKIEFHFFPEDFDPARTDHISDETLYPDVAQRDRSRAAYHFIKRTLDIFGALAGLMLTSPVFLVIPVLIKLTSKGPVLYRQRRVGRYGRDFQFMKFRTMIDNNDPEIHKRYIEKLITQQERASSTNGDSQHVYKIVNDPRVTPLGRFLRKTSLDELPQFLNVLKGEMSLVGPRPPIPYELAHYHSWHRRRVIEVKPGLTGLWQVKGRSRTTFDEMVRLDLLYVREQSLLLDLKIILKTPRAILKGTGAH